MGGDILHGIIVGFFCRTKNYPTPRIPRSLSQKKRFNYFCYNAAKNCSTLIPSSLAQNKRVQFFLNTQYVLQYCKSWLTPIPRSLCQKSGSSFLPRQKMIPHVVQSSLSQKKWVQFCCTAILQKPSQTTAGTGNLIQSITYIK